MNGTTGNIATGVAMSNPYSAAAMAAMQMSSALFASPTGPQMSSAGGFDPFTVDNSGWSVNFGSGSASATANPVSNLAQGLANAASGAAGGINLNNPFVLLGLAAIVIVIVKHGK
ncbi:hypothetical protein AWB76_04076 [Caballeronia temeraria]|uniref:Uncharacterized protein n=1 Tax=Caballeronia temeraria TaxID=1777137 RepID=A0A158BDX4_9BURK|nr:hypothetical protein [Caballeronia temeraria]SAK68252.1 hypothetical protein AWB76_04076 [Caballeronia temeraria]